MEPNFQECQHGILVAPQFLGATDYYAAIAKAGMVVVDTSMHFDKRLKTTHRATILSANSQINITVPIVKPERWSGTTWNDIIVSDHGQWWKEMWVSIQSAYGRTPYFEYYADDFLEIINKDACGRSLMELDQRLDALVRRLLGVKTEVRYGQPEECEFAFTDLRGEKWGKADCGVGPYYQLRADKYGDFAGGLSVIDLLMNMGPEGIVELIGK